MELPMAEPAIDTPPDFTAGRLLPLGELVSLAEFTQRRAEKLAKMIGTLEQGADTRAGEVSQSLASAGFDAKAQRDAASKARAKALTELRQNSEAARYEVLRELVAASSGLETTEALFASPQAVLARVGIGTRERSDMMLQLEGAGPAELRNMATLAVATKNTVLGAAVQAVVDRMPAKSRPLSTQHLAKALVGAETQKVQAAIAAVRHASQSAVNKNREFERGKAQTLERVRLALNNPNKEA
jgi:hypothetical protein